MKFDYDVTNTYPNTFNHRCEIYGLEVCYSQINFQIAFCFADNGAKLWWSLSYLVSRDFWGTGKSPSSVFPGEISRLGRGDALQRGMDKCTVFFALWIEGIQALYPWRKGDYTWSCCISKLHIVCVDLWTGGIVTGCNKRFCSYSVTILVGVVFPEPMPWRKGYIGVCSE